VNLVVVLLGLIGVGTVLGTEMSNGLSLRMLLQPTAFIIVIGGTLCATILNFDINTLKIAFLNSFSIFRKDDSNTNNIIKEIMNLCEKEWTTFTRKNY